ncbi:MAG: protease HtpX [Chlamydiales bacterium]|nr:protease HtpX [Chlamydiales bacterium]
MKTFKRIFLFIALNLAIMTMVSIIMALFNLKPFLNQYGIDYTELLIFCLLWGMGGALISLCLSRKMAKWMMRVKLVDSSHPLHQTVAKLSRSAKLSAIPEVGIFPSEQLNAFATGPTQKRSLVAVSSGLLEKMDEKQIEAILGHEISHIANGDMVTMTLLQGVVNAFVMFLARVLAFALSSLGRGNDRRSIGGSYYFFVIIFQLIFMVLGTLIICAYSRFREFRADKGGAKLTSTSSMVSALERLKTQHTAIAAGSMQAFMINNPVKKTWQKLFSTHPPLEERIERLEHHR